MIKLIPSNCQVGTLFQALCKLWEFFALLLSGGSFPGLKQFLVMYAKISTRQQRLEEMPLQISRTEGHFLPVKVPFLQYSTLQILASWTPQTLSCLFNQETSGICGSSPYRCLKTASRQYTEAMVEFILFISLFLGIYILLCLLYNI